MDLNKVYYDSDGLSRNILQLIKRAPEWAANRIQAGERALQMLSDEQRHAVESGVAGRSASTNTTHTAIAEMDTIVKCLALELPESVYEDVKRHWNAVIAQ